MVIIQCLKGFTVFVSQYYTSKKMLIRHDLEIDDCRTTCLSINKCNGFNYDWRSKNCTLLFDSSFGPSNIKTFTNNKNIAFYMKSQDQCNGLYYFMESNYSMFFIIIIIIISCCCYLVCKKVKGNTRMRRTMSRMSLIDNSVPPPYEERITETIAPTSPNTPNASSSPTSPISPTSPTSTLSLLLSNDTENESVPEYTFTIQNDDNEVINDDSSLV